ncbi:hypothetical protein ACFFMN_33995 [Planobispora siamensis]|uniref:hypothetical protein n=1 Tax=Planobispora siamensis TaxID=936338 RepID=UPI0035EAA158
MLRNLRIVLGVDFNESGLRKADRALAQIDKRLSAIGRRAMIGGGLAAAAGGATALTGALVPAAGAIAALPGVMATAGAASASLRVGLVGMGEAMEAIATGDAEALEESLAKLSPAARGVVKETAALKGAWTDLQQSVQETLFDGLAREMRPVAENLLPDIKTGMLGVAAGFNTGAKEAAKFAQTPMARGAVNRVFASSSRIMGQLAGATQPALQVITRLTTASLPLAERMAAWATNGVKSAAAFLNSERGAAALERTVDRAGDTLGQLGRIGGNVGRGLVGVFGSMNSSGEGVLDTIERLTARFATWSRSVEGQQQLTQFFRVLRETAADVGEVLPLVLGPLGALARLISGLPEPLRGAVTQLIALGVVLGPLASKVAPLASGVLHMVAAFRNAEGPVGRFRDRLAGMDGVAGRARGALSGMVGVLGGPWGIALAAGVGALALFATRNGEAESRVQDLTDALMRNKGALDENSAASIRGRLETEGVLQAAQKLKLSLVDVSEAALGNRAAMDRVNAGMEAAKARAKALDEQWGGGIAAAQEYSHQALKVRGALDGTNTELKEARERYQRLTEATPKTTAAADATADSFDGMGTSADGATRKLSGLTSQMARFRSLTGDADLAAISFRDSMDDLSEAIKKNGLRLDARTGKFNINTKAGRENNRMLIEAIRAAVDHADKLYKESKNVDVANAAFKRHMDRLRGVMERAGLSRQEIDRLVRRYATLPGQINSATNRIKDKTVRILVKANGSVVGYKIPGLQEARAAGGILPGWSPGKDIHTFYSPTAGTLGLSGGEAVMRPEWTRAVGPAAVDEMNAAARRGGVEGVRRLLADGVGPKHLRGEGAFFAGGGIIARHSITGMANINKTVAFAEKLYNTFAGRIGADVAKKVSAAMGGPGAQRGLAWARAQAGKPYIWGGVGPRGYDCSGLWSALVNVIRGRNPHSRLFTTWSFGGSSGPGGFVRNLRSSVRVGVTDAGVGHMAGTIGRTNIESRGSRGVVVGSAARGADNGLFTRRYGLKFDSGGVLPPGHTPVYNGTKKPEYVFTQRQMQQGIGGTTKVEINVSVPPTAQPADVGREVYRVLKEYQKRSFAGKPMGL